MDLGETTGVLLFGPEPGVIKSYDYREAAYAVITNTLEEKLVDPKTMETLVCKIGTLFLVKGKIVREALVKLEKDDGQIQGAMPLCFFFVCVCVWLMVNAFFLFIV